MSDDADIDALMRSVLGKDGTAAMFPPAPAAAPRLRLVTAQEQAMETQATVSLVDELFVDRATPAAARVARQGIAGLSGELAATLAKNAAPKVIDPRTVPVRFSSLKHISRSPLHYWDAVQLDRDDTLAMRLGRGAHAMVLDMPVVLYPGKTRQGKEWNRFKAEHPDMEILIRSEWAKAEGVARAIQRHADASQLLFDGTLIEQIIEWEFLGRKCTSRPDSRCASGRVITDLKTTQCAEPEKFARDAVYRAYNAQLAFYDMASEHETGRQADDLYVVAVESKRPFAITVLRVTDEAREQGRKLCRLWFEQVLLHEAANHYPAYVERVVDLAVPDEATDLTLTIDGEDYDFDNQDAT